MGMCACWTLTVGPPERCVHAAVAVARARQAVHKELSQTCEVVTQQAALALGREEIAPEPVPASSAAVIVSAMLYASQGLAGRSLARLVLTRP